MGKKILISLAAILALPSLAFSQSAFDPSEVRIVDLKYSGNGCPSGTVAHDISEDGQAFTILYDEFVAELDPTVSNRRERYRNATKACRLNFYLTSPRDWSFAVVNVDFSGYAQLDRGVQGIHAANVIYEGSGGAIRFNNMRLHGPFDDDYTRYDEIDVHKWSPCDRNQKITIQAKVSVRPPRRNRTVGGLMTVDSTDGEVVETYGLAWRRCR